jgi:hypothetical protein
LSLGLGVIGLLFAGLASGEKPPETGVVASAPGVAGAGRGFTQSDSYWGQFERVTEAMKAALGEGGISTAAKDARKALSQDEAPKSNQPNQIKPEDLKQGLVGAGGVTSGLPHKTTGQEQVGRISAPPPPKLPMVGTPPTSTEPVSVDLAINPLTGRSFSEERLDRLLAANKKVSAIIKEQTEQARLQNELASLGAGREQIESAKTRSHVINVIEKAPLQSSAVPPKSSVTKGESIVASTQLPLSPVVQPPVASRLVASGQIKIGHEVIEASNSGPSSAATVNLVDVQSVVASRPGQASANVGQYPGFPAAGNLPQVVAPAGLSPAGSPFVPAPGLSSVPQGR